MSWKWWLLKDNVDFERTCRVPARSQLAQIFHDPLFYASFLIFFCLILISLYTMISKEPNLKPQLLSDVLCLCDRKGAAASEHQNWSPNLLISLKSRQTSCCSPAAVRGLHRAMCQWTEQNYMWSCWILLDCQNLSQDTDLGPTVQYSANTCCYSNCCLQWLLLLFQGN